MVNQPLQSCALCMLRRKSLCPGRRWSHWWETRCVVGTRTGCHSKTAWKIATYQDPWECSEQIRKPKLTFERRRRFQTSDRAETNEKTRFIGFGNKGTLLSSAKQFQCSAGHRNWTAAGLVHDQRASAHERVETGWLLAANSLGVKGGLWILI